MRIVDFDDMEFHMKQWGRWMRDRSMITKLNYPQCDNLQKFRGMGNIGAPQISDDDALLIMRALEALQLVDKELSSIADSFFRLQWGQALLMENYNIVNRQKVRSQLDLAVTWVWGFVSRESKPEKYGKGKAA